MELIRPGTRIDFMRQSRALGVASMAVVAVFLVLLITPGPKLGVEFAGGTVIVVQVPEEIGEVQVGDLRDGLAGLGFASAEIVTFGAAEDREYRISVGQSEQESDKLSLGILDALSAHLGTAVILQKTESIGARVGAEMRSRGFGSVGLACLLILFYIWFRFDLRYAPGAVAALVHDVIFVAGIFVVLGVEFNLQVLAALLVVIGYSLNDTIVIYDRIRENLELRGTTHLADVVNQSINQTLSRTLLTSMTTLLVVGALLILGGPVIFDFALALMIGVVVGTYSTIYVASSLLIVLERYWGSRRPPSA